MSFEFALEQWCRLATAGVAGALGTEEDQGCVVASAKAEVVR